jgi:RNA polymerase-associated protein LEO1
VSSCRQLLRSRTKLRHLQFGDDDDDRRPAPVPRIRRQGTEDEDSVPETPASGSRDERNPLEYLEEEDGGQQEEVWASVPIPTWPKLQPTDGKVSHRCLPYNATVHVQRGSALLTPKVWQMKLPAYVNIEARPYDPEFYRLTSVAQQEPLDPSDNIGAKSRMIGIRNTVRWKWVTGPDGEQVSVWHTCTWPSG